MSNLKVVELPKRSGQAHRLCKGVFKEQVRRGRAKERYGEMVAAALVVVHRDGSIGHAYVSEDHHVFPLLGAVRDLEQRILTETVER